MIKRPFCGMTLGMLLGICIAAYGRLWQLLMVLGMLATVAVMGIPVVRKSAAVAEKPASLKAGYVIRFLLIAAALLLGWQRYCKQQEFRALYLPYLIEGAQVTVQGELGKKEIKNGQYVYELRSCFLRPNQSNNSEAEVVPCAPILAYSDTDIASIGEILILDGKIILWNRAVNEGNFDEKSFYEARGIACRLQDIRLQAVYGKKSVWREWLFYLKQKLERVYVRVMGENESGVLATMVLGSKGMLEEEMKRLYQIGGLSHILAISGLHISVIGMSFYRLLCKGQIGFFNAALLAGGLMYAYMVMTGTGVSAQRAVIMFFLMLGAQVVGRGYDTLNALGIAAVFLLWVNPRIFLDAGAQFSFAAVLGAGWLGKMSIKGEESQRDEQQKIKAKRQSRREDFRKQVVFCLTIQLVTLPLAAWYYYEIPLYAVLLNLLVLPWMGWLLAFGLAGGLGGLVSFGLAELLLFPCQKFLECSAFLCENIGKLPRAMWITGKPPLWKMILFYMLLVSGACWMQKRQKNLEMQRPQAEKDRRGGSSCGIARRLAAGFLLLLFLLWHPSGGFELDVLDVGQGDGSFLRTGQGITIFVDGGSSNVKKVGEYRILPFLKAKGAGKIDFWFVSHTDDDHISGLMELLAAGYPIRHLVVASGMKEDEAYTELTGLAEAAGTEILFVTQGDVLHFRESRVEVLSPVKDGAYEDKNSASLVFLYEEGDFAGIFTGDIDRETEEKILVEAEGRLGEKIDFYKAAHHGSKYSNSAELLCALCPKIATISCAEKNSYGHPGAETLERLKAVGSEIFCTMESGQIKVLYGKEGFMVEEYFEAQNNSRW